MSENPSQQPTRSGVTGWVLSHPKTCAAVAVILMLAAGVLGFSRKAEGELSRRIAAIRARGEPATVQDLIAARRPVPDEANRFLKLVSIGKQLQGISIAEQRLPNLELFGNSLPQPTGLRWTSAQLEAAEWYLGQAAPLLPELHAALKAPDSAYHVSWNSPAINVLLPELSHMRGVSKLALLEIRLAAQRGDRSESQRLLLESLPLLHAMDGDAMLMSTLVQVAVQALWMDSVERTINQGELQDDALARIGVALADVKSTPDLRRAFMTERVIFFDTVQWNRAAKPGPPAGGATGSPLAQFWGYVPWLPALDAANGLDALTALVNAIGTPDSETLKRVGAIEVANRSQPWYAVYSKMMLPSLSRVVVLWVRCVGQNRALRAAIAAERFRMADGHWPEGLGALVPRFLDAVPVDPIDGKPIRYAIIPEGIKTWTISDDGQNLDDGGDVLRLEKRSASQRPKDFGWVILNPQLRGREPASPSSTTQSALPPRPSSRQATE